MHALTLAIFFREEIRALRTFNTWKLHIPGTNVGKINFFRA